MKKKTRQKKADQLLNLFSNFKYKPDFLPKYSSEPLSLSRYLKELMFYTQDLFHEKKTQHLIYRDKDNCNIDIYKNNVVIRRFKYVYPAFIVDALQDALLCFLELENKK